MNCQFCHGADTRGGDSGPSLLRSQLVQEDQHGEGIAPVMQNGRPPRMPKFDFTAGPETYLLDEHQYVIISAGDYAFTINSRPTEEPVNKSQRLTQSTQRSLRISQGFFSAD